MVKSLTDEIEEEYAKVMSAETGDDKYTCTVEVLEDEFIKPESRSGKCGGVILSSKNRTIVCSNTLDERLHLCYEEYLPVLRKMLFHK